MAKIGSYFKSIFDKAQCHSSYWVEDFRLRFVEEITKIMEHDNVTMDELADKMSISKKYLNKILNDESGRYFNLSNIFAICFALGYRLGFLVLPWEDSEVIPDGIEQG